MTSAASEIPERVDFVDFLLSRHVGPGQTMLDVGCGPGHYRRATEARYVGLDRTLQPYAGRYEREVDVVGSALELPFAAEVFDLLLCKSTFLTLPDKDRALAEFQRVLKPGARLLIIDYNRRTAHRLARSDPSHAGAWTQWHLKRLVAGAGFRDCRLEVPKARPVAGPERWLRLLHQELFGNWAIVSAVR